MTRLTVALMAGGLMAGAAAPERTFADKTKAMEDLTKRCGAPDAGACAGLGAWLSAIGGGGKSEETVDGAQLQRRATALGHASEALSETCRAQATQPSGPRPHWCRKAALAGQLAQRYQDAADRMGKGGPACTRPLQCFVGCAAGIPGTCSRVTSPDVTEGGETMLEAIALGQFPVLVQSCVAGDAHGCALAVVVMGSLTKEPNAWRALEPELIDSVVSACELGSGCTLAAPLLSGSKRLPPGEPDAIAMVSQLPILAEAERTSLRKRLEHSCARGTSGEACQLLGQREKARAVRETIFKKEPRSLKGGLALVRWAMDGPWPSAEALAKDGDAFFQAFWTYARACEDGAYDMGVELVSRPCDPEREVFTLGLGSKFRDRIAKECETEHRDCAFLEQE